MAVRTPIDWKRASWEEACEEVAHFQDALGNTVDEGIFDTVVAFNLLGFPTWQSCEGHIDRGCSYPWVMFVQRELDQAFRNAWKQVCNLQDEVGHTKDKETYDRYFAASNAFQIQLAQWKRDDPLFGGLVSLIDAFYCGENRNPVRLMVNRFHPGICRIEMGNNRQVEDMSESLKALYLERSQAEMRSFTAWLRQRIARKERIDGGKV